MNQINTPSHTNGHTLLSPKVSPRTRGAALRAQRRNQDDANKIIVQYAQANQKTHRRANVITDEATKLKITFLGGLEDVGEKNMAVIEYGERAIILDCGNNLGIEGTVITRNDRVSTWKELMDWRWGRTEFREAQYRADFGDFTTYHEDNS